MQGKIMYNITFTLSKVVAILILLVGTLYSLIFRDGTVMSTSILTSGSLMGIKTGVDAYQTSVINKLTSEEKKVKLSKGIE